jgi:NADH dehydrogenase
VSNLEETQRRDCDAADILVLGGGFAGVHAALEVDRELDGDDDVRVVLVSRENFHLFTPLLAEVAASQVEPRHAVSPLRHMLRRVDFIQGTVRAVDPADRSARFMDETGRERRMAYRQCVLALGGVTRFFGIEGLRHHAFTLKTIGDAVAIRNHVIGLLERAQLLAPADRSALLTFVVAGGGLNGVEVAGEIHDFVIRAIRDYPGITPAEVRVMIVEMLDHLTPEMPRELGDYVRRNLGGRGIEIALETKIAGCERGIVRIEGDSDVRAETLIWTAGVGTAPVAQDVEVERVEGEDRLPTDPFLRVRGADGLWAAGDCALVEAGDGQGFQPRTAQHAVRQGRRAGRNAWAALRGEALRPYSYEGRGMLASLGHHRGAGQIFRVRLRGFLAWFAWRTYYLFALPRWERRIRVAMDWTLDLLFPPDVVELRLKPVPHESERGTVPDTESSSVG